MADSTARSKADEEWENLLRQWRAQPAARPRPYFYSRVRARLARPTAPARPPVRTWLRWPAYAVLLGILLLFSGDDAVLHAAGSSTPESGNRAEAGFGSD